LPLSLFTALLLSLLPLFLPPFPPSLGALLGRRLANPHRVDLRIARAAEHLRENEDSTDGDCREGREDQAKVQADFPIMG